MSHHANDELRENQYENRVEAEGAYPARKYYIILGANGAYNMLPDKMTYNKAKEMVWQMDAWLAPYVEVYAFSDLNPTYKEEQVRPILLHWVTGRFEEANLEEEGYKEVIDFYRKERANG